MPTYVSGGSSKEFTPAPEGAHQAVCADVIDHGIVPTAYGDKRKVSIRWQISEDMENGKPFLVSKRYTASLHEKANLRHDLESWRGREFTEQELEQFDMDNLIGANCLVNVIHNKDVKGKTWANVASITPLVKGMVKMAVSPDYVREKDREPKKDEAVAQTQQDEPDTVPF